MIPISGTTNFEYHINTISALRLCLKEEQSNLSTRTVYAEINASCHPCYRYYNTDGMKFQGLHTIYTDTICSAHCIRLSQSAAMRLVSLTLDTQQVFQRTQNLRPTPFVRSNEDSVQPLPSSQNTVPQSHRRPLFARH